jgi:ATP-dependent DNA helicase DinG
LEQRIVGFESRAGQQTMVREITEKMTQPNHCVIEAGTGVGKSLAYLIPGIWLAKTTGHKVVVATHTIPLQEQIVKKDLAMLSEALPFTFKSALVKGKSNYLCLRAWLAYLHQARDRSLEERLLALSVLVWLRETRSGDFQELPYGTGYWEVQVETNADVEACNPVKCAHGDVCFFMRARRQANQADLLVANHSLLFADIKAGRAILPEYDYLVVDEAHHLVDTAIEQFGSFISGKRIRAVLDRVNRIKGGSLVHQIRQKARSEQVLAYLVTLPQLAEQAKEQAAELFYLLEDILGKGHTYRFTEHSCGEPWWDSLETQLENLRNRVQQLDQALQRLSDGLAQEEDEDAQGINYDLTGCRGQLSMISEGFPYYLETQDPQRVTWLERSGRQILWRTCPIEVSALLRELLFNQTRSVILTSATLSVAGSFKYLYQDAGLETATQSLQVESPFCYEQQTRLFVVRDVFAADDSLVAGTAVSQAERLAQFLSQLAHILHGKTLVLFTAHQLLRATYDVLGNILDGAGEGIGILAQGIHGDRSAILEEFRHHPRNIILGASSYWEGIDLPGAMLECVVLVKLPFWSPSIPLIEARCDWLKLQNRNAFYDFMLPQAVVRFKQGFGRLIRTKTDRGYVIVLDDRLIKKSYGETFIRSLPTPSYQVGEAGKVLDRIRQFESVRV